MRVEMTLRRLQDVIRHNYREKAMRARRRLMGARHHYERGKKKVYEGYPRVVLSLGPLYGCNRN